jgi:DNA-3-methyladenine glycosylase II
VSVTATFSLTPRGPFSLAASIHFLAGFSPARYKGPDDGVLRLAFPVESASAEWPAAGFALRQPDGRDAPVVAEAATPLPDDVLERAKAQLARILSLDVDGSGFSAVGAADPVIAALQQRFDWLRPVCFSSPYEAAIWAVLSHRIRMSEAAGLKARIAVASGVRLSVAGAEVTAFPGPSALLAMEAFPGLPEVKLHRLQGLARAAAEGRLDAALLRAMPPEQALAELQRLPGIGPFSAELTLIRGAGAPDVFASSERRLHATMVELYGLPGSEPARLAEVARAWAPYRSWASVLLRSAHEARDPIRARVPKRRITETAAT